MTPKQKYEERKRLRTERRLSDARPKQRDDTEERMLALMDSFERIADALELWADMQGERE